MKFDILVEDCDISHELKESLKSEGYDTVNKIFCEPILVLLNNQKLNENWDELVCLFSVLNKNGTLDKFDNSSFPTLSSKIDSTDLNNGVKYILTRAGYTIISDIWHAGISGLRSITGMTDRALNEISSYMGSIGLELTN